MSTSISSIGKRIALARKNAGLTQATLAERIGISEKYLSRVECGKQTPTVMVIVKICESLCISADELLLTETIATHNALESKLQYEIRDFSAYDKEQIIAILRAIKSIKNKY